ncbi:MAG: hypothetical protein JO227_14780, partial [Acetobacteraceae bacterium]|nr:hypothetical protein [Acetobacteraceae bacterium]
YRWAREQPRGRFERIDEQVVAMAPESGGHVKSLVWLALRQAIGAAGVNCEALADEVAIAPATATFNRMRR